MNHNTQQKRCKIIEISNLFVFEEQNNFEKILCQKNMTEEKNTQQSDEKKIWISDNFEAFSFWNKTKHFNK